VEHLSIQTNQNVELEYEVASVGERAIAHVLDYMVFMSWFLTVVFFMALSGSDSMGAMILLIMLPIMFYDLVCELLFGGQSFGKVIIRIKVVKLNGLKVSFWNYLVRWVFRIVDNLLLMGGISVVAIFLSNKGQRLGDMAAGTTVIRRPKEKGLEKTIHVELPDDYKLVYPSASRLNDADITTVKQVIDHIRKNPTESSSAQMGKLAKDKIQEKMCVESDEYPLFFLEQVLSDYNYLNRD